MSHVGLLECTQYPGEILYIPSLWWHATGNIGDTIGVGAQSTDYITPQALSIMRNNEWIYDEGLEWGYEGCGATIAQLCKMVLPQNVPGFLINSPETQELSCGNPVTHRLIAERAEELDPLNIERILTLAESFMSYPIEYLLDHNSDNSDDGYNSDDDQLVSMSNTNGDSGIDGMRDSRYLYDVIPTTIPNPVSKIFEYLKKKVNTINIQYERGLISTNGAHQMIGRIGIWIEKVQEKSLKIGCPDGVRCIAWQAGYETGEMFHKTRSIYNKIGKKMNAELKIDKVDNNGIQQPIKRKNTNKIKINNNKKHNMKFSGEL